jgi:chaperonin cofactor prefoldin
MTPYDTCGIHTCHDNCQRIACVLRRELTAVTQQRDEALEYADKLAEGLPDGMLPKDVEVLREANLGLATNIAAVTEQRDRLRKRIAQLENELSKACNKVEDLAEIGLDQMDKERSTNKKLSDYRSQRDRLAMALQELCEALLTDKPRDITELLNKAGDALQFTNNSNEL